VRAMQKISIERSESEFYTAHSGLSLVGLLINRHTDLCRRADLTVAGTPSVSHSDVLKSYLGLLCVGDSILDRSITLQGVTWKNKFRARGFNNRRN